MQSFQQVKQAIDSGFTVHWGNMAYKVIRDSLNKYLVSYRDGKDYTGLQDIRYDISKCYLSKDDCKAIAQKNNVQFVCYEPSEDAYYFQSGDYQNGFYEYRLLVNNLICDKSARIMFKNGLTDTSRAVYESS